MFHFTVGSRVVYPAHGVGEITGEEIQEFGGHKVEVLVIALQNKDVILRVPVSKAKKELRPLCSKEQVDQAMKVLVGKPVVIRGMWSRKEQFYKLKLLSDLKAIAEVVRDLYRNVGNPERSYSESMIYETALDRLTCEIAAVLNLDLKQVIAMVNSLMKDKSKEQQETFEAA